MPNPIGAVGTAGGPFNPTSLPFQNPSVAGMSYIMASPTQEWIAGLPIWETPFETDPKEYIYHLQYKVKASAFVSMARDATGPYGGYHVRESNFTTSPGGILSFSREFARVPDSRNEFESYTFAYQIPLNSGSIEELPLTVTSRVQYDYFYTNQPETITLDRAPRAVSIAGSIYYINGFTFAVWNAIPSGTQILAEDAVLRIWKSKIYERVQRFVEHRNLITELGL